MLGVSARVFQSGLVAVVVSGQCFVGLCVVGDCGGSGVPLESGRGVRAGSRKRWVRGIGVGCVGERCWLFPFSCRAGFRAWSVQLKSPLCLRLVSTCKALGVAVVTFPFTWWLACVFIFATVFLLWLRRMCSDVRWARAGYLRHALNGWVSGSVLGAVCGHGPWMP